MRGRRDEVAWTGVDGEIVGVFDGFVAPRGQVCAYVEVFGTFELYAAVAQTLPHLSARMLRQRLERRDWTRNDLRSVLVGCYEPVDAAVDAVRSLARSDDPTARMGFLAAVHYAPWLAFRATVADMAVRDADPKVRSLAPAEAHAVR